jgi:hypothetical protein
MLLPEEGCFFVCKKDGFKTDNLFAYIEHFGVEYDWMVRLNPRFTFNLFTFLSEMAYLINENKTDEAWEHLQSATLLLVNASGEDFDEFIEEAQVVAGSEDMMEQIERFLNDGKDK